MEGRPRYALVCVLIECALVSAATYHVKIGSETANVVDKNFVSFTVDPQHLFTNVDSGVNSECYCMASLLAPAYLRIAGPSTNHMTFHNTTITIDNVEDSRESFFGKILKNRSDSLKITAQQWRRFVDWAQKTGFRIVFALGNGQKTEYGLWDTNSTMEILSTAEKANFSDIFWQLGYECTDQSIDEYLNDLETLKLMVESISSDRGLGWRVLGGDVSQCFLESKSDFKDYVTLSLDMMDAAMLDGNSSYHELAQLSTEERDSLLQKADRTPLWQADRPSSAGQFQRAADWAASLGRAARSGFQVHYWELAAEELYRPTLSFYMAFLFKELVGDIALPVDSQSSSAATNIFAHCTSLRRKRVPGAVTVYGVNRGQEPARVSLQLSEREKGGEIMQFILNHDENGHIVVNGRIMSKKGDIRPVLKRVGPFKTLVINLPPKSFGFWVLANTNIKACHEHEYKKDLGEKENSVENNEVNNTDEDNKVRSKRSALLCENNGSGEGLVDLRKLADKINLINGFNNGLDTSVNSFEENKLTKVKRQIYEKGTRKSRRQAFGSKLNKNFGLKKKPVSSTLKKMIKQKYNSKIPRKIQQFVNQRKLYRTMKEREYESSNNKYRPKRNIVNDKHKKEVEQFSDETKIDLSKESEVPWEVLNNIVRKMKTVFDEEAEEVKERSDRIENSIVNTEQCDGGASLTDSEEPDYSMVKGIIERMFSVMAEFNKHLRKICDTLSNYTEM